MIDNFHNLPQGWEVKTLGECLEYEQPSKYIVKNTQYSDEHEIPVLTAGKSFVLGYTDDTENIFTQIPVIIFDDFTTDSKFVDFCFKVKSSAMKILHATKIANIKFVFYFMQTIQYRSDTHKRYWISEYAKLPIPLPPVETQQKIVAKLESEFAKIEAAKSHLEKVKETIPRLKNSLLKSAFSGKLTESALIASKVQQSTMSQTLDLTMESDIIDCHEAKASRNDESLPQGWAVKALGEVCEKIQKRSKNYQKTEFDYIDISSINNTTNMIEKTEKYDAAKAPSRAQQIIQGNDILFSNVRTYLKNIAFVEEKYNNCIASTGFCVIRIKKDILLPKFIFYQVLSDKFISPLNMLQRGSSYPAVRNSDVFNQIVIVPPLQTQKQIVEILDSKFATLENLEKETNTSLEKLQKLKSSLLNQAFKGELIC